MPDIPLLTTQEFSELDEVKQLKEIYSVYGMIVFLFIPIDEKLVFLIKVHHDYKMGALPGKFNEIRLANIRWNIKLKKHYDEKATLGLIVNDFCSLYDVAEFKSKFVEMVEKRNAMVHNYMKGYRAFEDSQAREAAYRYLLSLIDYMQDFIESIKNRKFRSTKFPELEVELKY
ncbi:hypothetical protein [Pedobacter sp. Leaf170]|uniref:hypothetical protein n=1 Tax=Pedobacter sp. Leaf170 TaxID=2876558 RepID=UPI001E4811C3|nr:hypothetical protein [Pedobacter sp. Leaf170]